MFERQHNMTIAFHAFLALSQRFGRGSDRVSCRTYTVGFGAVLTLSQWLVVDLAVCHATQHNVSTPIFELFV